mgnify:CR=1 FL=1
MSKKNLIAGQSGGPTAAINSSLYGVVSEALKHTEEIDHVYGMVNGIEGFLNGTVLDFQEALPGEQLRALTWTPGAYLGSCRYKLPESLEDPVYPKLFRKFEEMNIGWFFYIGGNDSMDTVSKLSRYAEKIDSDIRILGEPKTIDNDLVNTDHTPDLTPVIGASEIIGRNLAPGSIVVYESTVYPGCTEDVCIPILERESGLKCGVDFK